MAKKTRLGEDAAIYQRHRKQSEKEKLKGMPIKYKLSYLWDYYRYHALIIIVSAIFIAYVVYTFNKPKIENQLYTVIINNTVEPQIWDDYTEIIADYLELDTQSEKVVLNYTFYYNGDLEYESSMRQAFGVYMAAAELDVVIAPMSEFSNYVNFGFLTPLSDQLPTDLYSSLTDKFYLSGTDDDPKVDAYGIYLKDTELYKEHSLPTDDDPVLIGIIANSTHRENAVKFIRYLFNEK